jgi:hypothetical protein
MYRISESAAGGLRRALGGAFDRSVVANFAAWNEKASVAVPAFRLTVTLSELVLWVPDKTRHTSQNLGIHAK